MRKTTLTLRLTLAAAAGLVLACSDTVGPDGRLYPDNAKAGISDALHGDGVRNPHFFWLPPVVEDPPSELLGTFDPGANPTVKLYCESAPSGETCPEEPIASFTTSTGVMVQDDHYQLQFDTKAEFGTYGFLKATVLGGATYTYRFSVEVPGYPDAFEVGSASFQLGESGKDVNSLAAGYPETVALKDGRTLPLKFRIDQGAFEYEAAQPGAIPSPEGYPFPELCELNCSVTRLDPDSTEPQYVYLLDTDVGFNTTGVVFQPGDLPPLGEGEKYTLLIDHRVTDDETEIPDGYTCYADPDLQQWDCYRYLIFPDVVEGFTNPVLVGICDVSALANNSPEALQIGKVDYSEGGDPTLEFLDYVDASELLSCEPEAVGALSSFRSAVRYAFDWLVPPAYAQRTTRAIGGMANDFSDLFLTPLQAPGPQLPGTILFEAEGTTGTTALYTIAADFDASNGGTNGAGRVDLGGFHDRYGVESGGWLVWSALTLGAAGSEPSATLRLDDAPMGSGPWTIVSDGSLNLEPDWHPTMPYVAYAKSTFPISSPVTFDIYTVALVEPEPGVGGLIPEGDHPITAGRPVCTSESPAWSPDGTQLAYASDCGGWHINVWEMDGLNTSGEFPTMHEVADRVSALAWVDPGHILFEMGGRLYVLSINDETTAAITPTGIVVSSPVVSPDGNWIAFAVNGEIRALRIPDLTDMTADLIVGEQDWVLVTDRFTNPRPTDWME